MHSDQADTLRRLMTEHSAVQGSATCSNRSLPQANVTTIASGKGGVGKTSLVANLGTLLARSGQKTLLVDGDFGLANLDILLGVSSTATLEQVIHGEATLQEAIVGIEPNLWLLPASAGLSELRAMSPEMRGRFIECVDSFPWETDYILIDAGAGIQQNVLSLHSPAYQSVIVLTPEPTSFTDGFGLMKTLRKEVGIQTFTVIVNQVADGREGQTVFNKFKDVSTRLLPSIELEYLGHWQRDEKITQAVMKRKILLDLDEDAVSIPSLGLLAKRFQLKFPGNSAKQLRSGRFMEEPAQRAPGNTAEFWRTMLGEVKA